jgi:hypothetical protein
MPLALTSRVAPWVLEIAAPTGAARKTVVDIQSARSDIAANNERKAYIPASSLPTLSSV